MSEEMKDKPIHGLLRDISLQGGAFTNPPRGLLSTQMMDRLTILTALLGLFLTMATFLGMIWEVVDLFYGFRIAGTIAVVVLSMLVFRAINALFD